MHRRALQLCLLLIGSACAHPPTAGQHSVQPEATRANAAPPPPRTSGDRPHDTTAPDDATVLDFSETSTSGEEGARITGRGGRPRFDPMTRQPIVPTTRSSKSGADR